MRILILADDCNPEWPSLPVVGYKAAKALAEKAEVVVATHIRNRENIETAGFGRASVTYIDNEYIARPIYKLATWLRGGTSVGWTTNVALAYPSYIAFEREVWKHFKTDINDKRFDIVHRLTPMSPTLPSPMASWCKRYGVPFVLGPLNGGLKWPAEYRAELAREREWMSYLREAYRYLPYRRSTYAESAAILAAFAHTAADIGPEYADRMIHFPEVGIDPEVFSQGASTQTSSQHASAQKTFLFVGRLVPFKLPRLAVEAFGMNPALLDHRMRVVGDGPERADLEAIIRQNGWAGRIELCGWKTQGEVAELMRTSDVLVQPSIRELGAGVVIEAMACGLACVVTDYGGPAYLIEADRGIKLPLAAPDELRRSFSDALARLANDPALLDRLKIAARRHAETYYTWQAKADETIRIYDWVLGRGRKPQFASNGT
ncbi:glycosyltransferase involved in cell wall biosynthesis [Bradyrhizobium sp. USDA 4463]